MEQITRREIRVDRPNFGTAIFHIEGTSPLVVHRFSAKTKQEMLEKMIAGKVASSKKVRKPTDTDVLYKEAKYMSKEGWEGFNASAMRNAMISACRLIGFKMTLAKMSVFIEADGWDATEPQIPLIRIYGKSEKFESMARVETGQPYVTIRAAYNNWSSRIKIRWDAGQFSIEDITNLLARVGMQVGICEGRPDSKNSAGMGWGLFTIKGVPDETG